MSKIDLDLERFNRKVKSLKADALKRYFRNEEMGAIDQRGRVLRIPIRKLVIPQFRYGWDEKGGVGMGEGKVGTPISIPGQQRRGHPQDGDEEGDLDDLDDILEPGGRRAVNRYDPVDHELVEVTRAEVAEGLQEILKLPNLRETFSGETPAGSKVKYRTIRRVGPGSLVHFKRTYKTALKRMIGSGEYSPENPQVIPRNEDRRFKASKESFDITKAVVLFLLDCSGSMLTNLDFLQDVAWLADCWIEKEYPNTTRRYIHYDHLARESTAERFYHISAGGENHMGVAYLRAHQILQEYPSEQYNRFLVHLTDGDPFGLEVSEGEVAQYQRISEMYPDQFPEMHLTRGNPLLDKILPNVNALFVCEAGAYYGAEDGRFRGWGGIEDNYSALLAKIGEDAPVLRNKIRCVSFQDEQISAERGECKMETMRAWFGKKE